MSGPPPDPLLKYWIVGKSILNASFVATDSQTVSYATRTTASITTVYRLTQNGQPHEMAKIFWTGHATANVNSRTPTFQYTDIHASPVPLSSWLTKGTSLLSSSSSRRFAPYSDGHKTCKWSTGNNADRLFSSIRDMPPVVFTLPHNVWACRTENSGGEASSLLSVLLPPQQGVKKGELLVYGSGTAVLNDIILSSIMVCSQPDDWTRSTSRGEARPTSSRSRRPQTAHGTSRRTIRHEATGHGRVIRPSDDEGVVPSPTYGSWFHDPAAPPPPYDSMVPAQPPT